MTIRNWVIDVEYALGDQEMRPYGGEGMAIFFTDKLSSNYEEDWQHAFGFKSIFKGVGIYL